MLAARGVGAVSRRSGLGGGTSLPGKVLLRLQTDAITRMAAGLTGGSVVISATNGKTTTASLLASILAQNEQFVVHNSAGANMAGGVATALLEQLPTSRQSNLDSAVTGLFEVDEAWVSEIVGQLQPQVVVLCNLFRDQLDRYGELDTLADSWQAVLGSLASETSVLLNADDPLIASLGRELPNVTYFGIDDESNAEATMRHAADSKNCRACGGELSYSVVQLGHLGKWFCQSCGYARPQLDVAATQIALHGMRPTEISIRIGTRTLQASLPLPGLYNAYNAIAAVAAAHALGAKDASITAGLLGAQSAFGRVESIDIDGAAVALMLIKNPTGANEVLRTISQDDDQFDLWIALNDNIADGRDVSWVWDADFELLSTRVRRVVCSGTRADELALRLAYAGIPRDRLTVSTPIFSSFKSAAAAALADGVELRALPTYTALLELRTALTKHGYAKDYWQ
ncbi:MAG: DUF1727 domain-containing protein [Thermoleophilaceae bacterium]|nr:DUF1727 domain-containing protein [Thermoleophilaceae bacterium]